MKKIILLTILITSVLMASNGELKRAIKVVPLNPSVLSTENGGTLNAVDALSDGVGIYATDFDEYGKAVNYLTIKYGDEAKKEGSGLKDYVIDNGTAGDKELALKLNPLNENIEEPQIGEPCDDLNPLTENDMYIEELGNIVCKGEIPYSYTIKCEGVNIGDSIQVEGTDYLVVDNDTIHSNLNNAEFLCTSNVTDMGGLFLGATSFNQDIGRWDVSNVTDMSYLFYGVTSFNQDIGGWNVSNVSNILYMFKDATSFNQDLSSWCVSNFSSLPIHFNLNTPSWTLPKPIWGTCP